MLTSEAVTNKSEPSEPWVHPIAVVWFIRQKGSFFHAQKTGSTHFYLRISRCRMLEQMNSKLVGF